MAKTVATQENSVQTVVTQERSSQTVNQSRKIAPETTQISVAHDKQGPQTGITCDQNVKGSQGEDVSKEPVITSPELRSVSTQTEMGPAVRESLSTVPAPVFVASMPVAVDRMLGEEPASAAVEARNAELDTGRQPVVSTIPSDVEPEAKCQTVSACPN